MRNVSHQLTTIIVVSISRARQLYYRLRLRHSIADITTPEEILHTLLPVHPLLQLFADPVRRADDTTSASKKKQRTLQATWTTPTRPHRRAICKTSCS